MRHLGSIAMACGALWSHSAGARADVDGAAGVVGAAGAEGFVESAVVVGLRDHALIAGVVVAALVVLAAWTRRVRRS